MPRRRPRSALIQRLVTPVAARVRRRLPRTSRAFPAIPVRWSLARRPIVQLPTVVTKRGPR